MERGAPSVSYLLFADELLIFARMKQQDSEAVRACSGQKINCAKSSIFFSSNFHGQQLMSISDYFGLKRLLAKAKHLGLPLLIPQSKGLAFEDLKKKLMVKLASW